MLSHIGSYPVNIVADLRVYPGVKQSSTSNAPTDNTAQVSGPVSVVANHGTSRVTLTTVFASLSSTEHAVGNHEWIFQPEQDEGMIKINVSGKKLATILVS